VCVAKAPQTRFVLLNAALNRAGTDGEAFGAKRLIVHPALVRLKIAAMVIQLGPASLIFFSPPNPNAPRRGKRRYSVSERVRGAVNVEFSIGFAALASFASTGRLLHRDLAFHLER